MRFEGCTLADLEILAAALASGRVKLPATEIAVARIGIAPADAVARELASLADLGFSAAPLAELLKTVAEERRRAMANAAQTELVVTGPDGAGIMRDTAVVVEQLFAEARRSVLVVGFALYKGVELFRKLAAKMDVDPELAVTLCLDISRAAGQTTRDGDIVDAFARDFVLNEWPGKRLPALYYYPLGLHADRDQRAVLHAKCVVIDGEKALVTSANPTPAAYNRNIELGVLMAGSTIASQIAGHFAELIKDGVLKRVSLPARALVRAK